MNPACIYSVILKSPIKASCVSYNRQWCFSEVLCPCLRCIPGKLPPAFLQAICGCWVIYYGLCLWCVWLHPTPSRGLVTKPMPAVSLPSPSSPKDSQMEGRERSQRRDYQLLCCSHSMLMAQSWSSSQGSSAPCKSGSDLTGWQSVLMLFALVNNAVRAFLLRTTWLHPSWENIGQRLSGHRMEKQPGPWHPWKWHHFTQKKACQQRCFTVSVLEVGGRCGQGWCESKKTHYASSRAAQGELRGKCQRQEDSISFPWALVSLKDSPPSTTA